MLRNVPRGPFIYAWRGWANYRPVRKDTGIFSTLIAVHFYSSNMHNHSHADMHYDPLSLGAPLQSFQHRNASQDLGIHMWINHHIYIQLTTPLLLLATCNSTPRYPKAAWVLTRSPNSISETRLLTPIYPLAGTNAYHAPVKIPTVTLYPLWKLLCHLTSHVKPLTQQEMKELRMGGTW